MPAASQYQASTIVVAADAALASSLELALQAAGLTVIVYDPAHGLADLPLDVAMTLIADHRVLTPNPVGFVATLRARHWDGLVIVMTGDGEAQRVAFEGAWRVSILEMPFVGADLIAAIRAVWPSLDGSTPAP